MNLLVDTHLLLWSAFRSDRLSTAARRHLDDPGNALWFSVVSIWEVAIKRAQNKPDFRIDPGPLRAGLLASGYAELPVEGRHALGVGGMPRLHGDPFDRMLVAQAAVDGLLLLTSDRKLMGYDAPVRLV